MAQEPFLEPASVAFRVLESWKKNAQIDPVVDLNAGYDEVEEEHRAELVLADLKLDGG